MAGEIIVRLAYGYQPQATDGSDRFITLAEKRIKIILSAINPTWLVNLLPAGAFIPTKALDDERRVPHFSPPFA